MVTYIWRLRILKDADKGTADAIVATGHKNMNLQEWYHMMMYQSGSGALFFSQSRDTGET